MSEDLPSWDWRIVSGCGQALSLGRQSLNGTMYIKIDTINSGFLASLSIFLPGMWDYVWNMRPTEVAVVQYAANQTRNTFFVLGYFMCVTQHTGPLALHPIWRMSQWYFDSNQHPADQKHQSLNLVLLTVGHDTSTFIKCIDNMNDLKLCMVGV